MYVSVILIFIWFPTFGFNVGSTEAAFLWCWLPVRIPWGCLGLSSQVLKGLVLSNLSQGIASGLSIIIGTTKIKILNSGALKLNNREIHFTKFVTSLRTTGIMRTDCAFCWSLQNSLLKTTQHGT